MSEAEDATELQLLGLKTLADAHSRAIDDITAAARKLTGETDEHDHCGDWLCNHSDRRTPAQLLSAIRKREGAAA